MESLVKSKNRFSLPNKYKMKAFPAICDFWVPGFKQTHPSNMIQCLCPVETQMEECFEEFCERLDRSFQTRKYLPVLRIGDGELEFIFGRHWFNSRNGLWFNFLTFLRFLRDKIQHGRGLNAFTVGLYSSGRYSAEEVNKFRPLFIQELLSVMNNGIVAFHLFVTKAPFSDQYFPILDDFLCDCGTNITPQNVLPGYFVYSFFVSPRAKKIFEGKRVGVVHSADGARRAAITESIINQLGVSSVHWVKISLDRSFTDIIDEKEFVDCDSIFVGAGIGKVNIFAQLHNFCGPVLDLGYLFEAWHDRENKFKRVYCATDDDWQSRGVENVFEAGI